MLLHDGPPRHSSIPPLLLSHTLSISTACLKAINNFAILNLHMVQVHTHTHTHTSVTSTYSYFLVIRDVLVLKEYL